MHYPLYYDEMLLRARYTLHTKTEKLPRRNTETGYGARHAHDYRPSARSLRLIRRRVCASRPWLASSSARSFPAIPM